jgi:hypothetical protein
VSPRAQCKKKNFFVLHNFKAALQSEIRRDPTWQRPGRADEEDKNSNLNEKENRGRNCKNKVAATKRFRKRPKGLTKHSLKGGFAMCGEREREKEKERKNESKRYMYREKEKERMRKR